MTISTISSAAVPAFQPASSLRQNFGQLASALQSGNLDAAQSAYTALTQSLAESSNVSSSGPLAQAIGQIGDALQSGDIGKAQQALASLQQQTQGPQAAHRHHGGGHHHSADATQTSATTAALDPTATPASTSLLDVTA